MAITATVIAEDSRLESAATRTSEELAKHRWHWTLDESNAARVSLREYARLVRRDERTIRAQANAYALLAAEQETAAAGRRNFSEHLERARVGADKEAAIDAIAKAGGTSFKTARMKPDVVRDVIDTARERVDRGAESSMEDALRRAAEDRARTERTNERLKQERSERHTLRYTEIEGHVAAAMQRLRKALDTAEGVEFSDEERELIADSLGKLRAVLNLIDVRIVGETNINWDAELAKLGGNS